MILTYEYRIRPNNHQEALLLQWLELLRRHWNYCLGQRLDWLHRTRCFIDRCSLVSQPIGEIPECPNYSYQSAQLKQTKEVFPEYKQIYHEVQQQNLLRLDKAWQRWLFPDATGKRGGRPKFKKAGELRSFTFPRVNCPKAGVHITGQTIKFSKIGEMPIILHRPLPEGFTPKTCTVVQRADGWYVCITLEDKTVPAPAPKDKSEIKNATGIDLGLNSFLVTAQGEEVSPQQFYRRSERVLARRQKQLSRKQKGSANYQKSRAKVSRLHLRIKRQRKDFHYKEAYQLCRTYDLIGVEDLNIRGLARSKLAKSILDAAWGQFLTILAAVAVKCGVWMVKVNPQGTSQECANCGATVPKTLADREHRCACGLNTTRDRNSARVILKRALHAVGLTVSACGGLGVAQPVKQEIPIAMLEAFTIPLG